MAVFDEIVGPAAQRFQPDIILVSNIASAGLCSHHDDQIFITLAGHLVLKRQTQRAHIDQHACSLSR